MKIKVVMFVVLFVGTLLIVSNHVLAQSASQLELQWSKTYSGHSGASFIIPTHDGGYVIAGCDSTKHMYGGSTSTYVYTPYVMKINSNHKVGWIKTYAESYDSRQWFMQTSDLGYFLAHGGWYEPLLLLKTDSRGNLEWNQTLDLKQLPDIQFNPRDITTFVVVDDGNYVISTQNSPIDGFSSAVILKCSNDSLFWQKTFSDDKNYVFSKTVLVSSSGDGYFVAGNWGLSGWFAKLDLNGAVVWSRIYDYPEVPRGSSLFFDLVTPTLDGGFVLGGRDSEFGWIVKVDSEGNELWCKRYGVGGSGHYSYEYGIMDVVEWVDGSVLVFDRLGISCLDASGDELWFESYSKYMSDFMGSGFDDVNVGGVHVIGSDGSLVVMMNYGSDEGSMQLGDSDYGLWVAEFGLDPVSSLNWGYVLLFGVVIVVGVGVFVGFLIYLKKYRPRRIVD
ncbi:MAG: hypothetical protein FWH37_06740 [Candidatus Bathyarchaeota archaeon]|nr:hypothetical protein [Candidatus Termiticorpusculum sp.]